MVLTEHHLYMLCKANWYISDSQFFCTILYVIHTWISIGKCVAICSDKEARNFDDVGSLSPMLSLYKQKISASTSLRNNMADPYMYVADVLCSVSHSKYSVFIFILFKCYLVCFFKCDINARFWPLKKSCKLVKQKCG